MDETRKDDVELMQAIDLSLAPQIPPNISVNKKSLECLLSMGFPESRSITALAKFNNLEAAISCLVEYEETAGISISKMEILSKTVAAPVPVIQTLSSEDDSWLLNNDVPNTLVNPPPAPKTAPEPFQYPQGKISDSELNANIQHSQCTFHMSQDITSSGHVDQRHEYLLVQHNTAHLLFVELAQNECWKKVFISTFGQLDHRTTTLVTGISWENENLTGSIPESLSNLKMLTTLLLNNNELTGTIPSTLRNLKKLRWLHLNNNRLTGSIPEEISELKNLKFLHLNNNLLTGSIPKAISNCTNIQHIYLQKNQLTGTIPQALWNLTSMEKLDLSHNQLTGSIPFALCNLTSAKKLDLSYNQLTGPVPKVLEILANSRILYLEGNRLTDFHDNIAEVLPDTKDETWGEMYPASSFKCVGWKCQQCYTLQVSSQCIFCGSQKPQPDPSANSEQTSGNAVVGCKGLQSPHHFSSYGSVSKMHHSVLSDCSPNEMHNWLIEFKDIEIKDSDKIGKGGFGQVYKAKWHGSSVAVKMLLNQTPDEDTVRAFNNEISIFSKLRHPNIAQFFGACITPYHAIVMDFYVNGTLEHALKHMIPPPRHAVEQFYTPTEAWPWSLIEKIAYETACGMEYLHACIPPILHRDLKSANILLGENYKVKLTDFGLSKTKLDGVRNTMDCGTCGWMAPEVMEGREYDERADVYSYAVVCWELLERTYPYKGMMPIQIAIQVTQNQLRPKLPTWCPAHYKEMITFSWKQDPNERPTFKHILDLNVMPWNYTP